MKEQEIEDFKNRERDAIFHVHGKEVAVSGEYLITRAVR